MKLAECGWRIKAMPSKQQWTTLGASKGFKVVRNMDLTHEAILFGYLVGKLPG